MASLRRARGLTQEQLATLTGVSRGTLATWESGGIPRSDTALLAVANALGVLPEHLSQEWPDRKELKGLKLPPMYAPPFPNQKGIQDILQLSPRVRSVVNQVHSNPALAYQMRDAYPRETEWELLAAHDLLVAGVNLEFWSTDELGCLQLVTEMDYFRNAGMQLRHTLRWNLPDATLLLMPQVTLAVPLQSRRYRPDFLGLFIGKPNFWFTVEFDGRLHLEKANEDARRAVGLGMRELRYPNEVVARHGFPQ